MTDEHGFRVRTETRHAIARLVKAAGARMVIRPLVRSEPQGPAGQEPEPLAGIREAAALEREARRQCLESVRYAREDGLTWRDVAAALGLAGRREVTFPAGAAWQYACPGSAHGDYFLWTCPSCARNIRDHGPELAPGEAEQGHAEGCGRLAATVAAWEQAWEAGGDD